MPIQVVCPSCGQDYNFKDDFSGKKVRCTGCQAVLDVRSLRPDELPPLDAEPVDSRNRVHRSFDRDKFLLKQKHLSLSQKYVVLDEDGQTILFIERPHKFMASLVALILGIVAFLVIIVPTVALIISLGKDNEAAMIVVGILGGVLAITALGVVYIKFEAKRHIGFYEDESKNEFLLMIEQDKKFVLTNATYTCRDPEGNVLATFHKNYLWNMIRRRWYINDANGNVIAIAMEDSIILSLLRRVLGDFLFGLLRTNFIIVAPDWETLLGEFNRKFTLFDRYVLDMSHDRSHRLDRRVAIALGVMLDTGEHR